MFGRVLPRCRYRQANVPCDARELRVDIFKADELVDKETRPILGQEEETAE